MGAGLSRREFVTSLSAFSGSSLGVFLASKIFGQDPMPSESDIRRALQAIYHHPFDVPQPWVDSALQQADLLTGDLQALKGLILIFVASKDQQPMVPILDQAIRAAEGSEVEFMQFVDQVRSKGLTPDQELFPDLRTGFDLFTGPFASELEDWIKESPDANAPVPRELFSDQRFAGLLAAACGQGSRDGVGCGTVGQMFAEITAGAEGTRTREPVPWWAWIVIAVAIALAIAIAVVFLLTPAEKQPCEIADLLISKTVDNKDIPEDKANKNGYLDVLRKLGEKQHGMQNGKLLSEIEKCLDADADREGNKDRANKIRTLAIAVAADATELSLK